MPTFIIKSLQQKNIEVSPEKTFLQELNDHSQDWMQACGGKGRCVTCRVEVLKGAENLSEITEVEAKYQEQGKLKPNERLSCQTKLLQDSVTVAVPEPCRLPHLSYND